jgi:hypothetical protein
VQAVSQVNGEKAKVTVATKTIAEQTAKIAELEAKISK